MTITIPNLKTVSLDFTVLGTPQPGGSKRAVPAKGGRFAYIIPDNKRTKPWMDSVRAAAHEAFSGPMLTCPVKVRCTFWLTRPKGHYGTGKNAGAVKVSAPTEPTTKPDLTKLWRSTEDALKGIVWRDDSQVTDAALCKRYGEPARAEVEVKWER